MADLESLARRTWAGEGATDRALRAALAPAAAIYGAVAGLRNRLYDAGWLRAARVPAQVISVGNLAVGGTGKTPTALWLAERLAARGRRVAIVARGYRKRRRGVVVVGDGGHPLVSAADGGDEAVLLARRFAGPVITAEERTAGAMCACTQWAADTIVLDDGFQHRALARDADLVLLDPGAPSRVLPAGPLREPPEGLGRATAILVVGSDGALPAVPGIPSFRGRLVADTLVRADWGTEPLEELRGRAVVAVAGVARPDRFAATLEAAGARVRELLRFPDHHPYTDADVARIRAVAGDLRVVTTEKDLVKVERLLPDVRAVRVSLHVDDGDRLVGLLAAATSA